MTWQTKEGTKVCPGHIAFISGTRSNSESSWYFAKETSKRLYSPRLNPFFSDVVNPCRSTRPYLWKWARSHPDQLWHLHFPFDGSAPSVNCMLLSNKNNSINWRCFWVPSLDQCKAGVGRQIAISKQIQPSLWQLVKLLSSGFRKPGGGVETLIEYVKPTKDVCCSGNVVSLFT